MPRQNPNIFDTLRMKRYFQMLFPNLAVSSKILYFHSYTVSNKYLQFTTHFKYFIQAMNMTR